MWVFLRSTASYIFGRCYHPVCLRIIVFAWLALDESTRESVTSHNSCSCLYRWVGTLDAVYKLAPSVAICENYNAIRTKLIEFSLVTE